MANEFIKYKFNSYFEIDLYNSIGKDTIISIDENDNMFYVQGEYQTPIFNIGQGDKTIQEHIEYLTNKGILEEVKE